MTKLGGVKQSTRARIVGGASGAAQVGAAGFGPQSCINIVLLTGQ